MKKSLYLECYSGISGDMTVAALLDLGADEEVLRKALASVPVDGFEIAISRVKKSGLTACDFDVKLYEDNHDHDMEYLHGKGHSPHREHSAHTSSHIHRGIRQIQEIIAQSSLTVQAKETALKIFQILAEAESMAHGVPVEQVHFHEVGAVDSIVDILSVAICLDNLKVDEVIISPLWEGQGTIRCQHGIIPVPVPAVANIASLYGLTLHPTGVEGELVTPTGAAIAAAIDSGCDLPKSYRITATGLGAGKRDYPTTGVLRAMLLESEETTDRDLICKLETNLDDCTGEQLGYVMELLFEEGARDVHYTPVFMKKNRPGYQLTVLCTPKMCPHLENIIFRETTSIGIRHILMERTVLAREQITVKTSLGEARVKQCSHGQECFTYPEYEDAAKIAREKKLPLVQVMEEIQNSVTS